jgi:hypothetical protein
MACSLHSLLTKGPHRYLSIHRCSCFWNLTAFTGYLHYILLVCCIQKHDYDAALVGAFRREQEKAAELNATIAAKQIAEQLVRSSSNDFVFLPYERKAIA